MEAPSTDKSMPIGEPSLCLYICPLILKKWLDITCLVLLAEAIPSNILTSSGLSSSRALRGGPKNCDSDFLFKKLERVVLDFGF